MTASTKGKSPFYPAHPVPVEFFVGRQAEIEKMLTRGVSQVTAGKPVTYYIQGEYGIGKSSLAGFVQWLADKNYQLHGIYANLGGCRNLNDMAIAVLEATVRSGVFHPTRAEQVGNWLSRYISKHELFGNALDFTALKQDAPSISSPYGMLGFLSEAKKRLEKVGVKGMFLILDEINGISSDKQFAHFIKGLVDSNVYPTSLPLLLVLCGIEERRREMIRNHQPIERIFDIIEVGALSEEEMREFFTRAFQSVQMTVDEQALKALTFLSQGYPKIMQLVGDAAFWADDDGVIDASDAARAIVVAADEVGNKYVDEQVFRALRSDDYLSILKKISKIDLVTMTFTKAEIESQLSDTEKRKFSNFLQRMKKLNVLRSGEKSGQYIFNLRMVLFYIRLRSFKK